MTDRGTWSQGDTERQGDRATDRETWSQGDRERQGDRAIDTERWHRDREIETR